VEELVGFCGSELVINPANDSLNRRTQHLMQPNMPIIHSFRNHLWIRHIFPSQHPSDPPLSTNVFSQSVGIEGVRGDVRVVGTGIYIWTRVEER